MQKKIGKECHCEGAAGDCGNLNLYNMKNVYFLRSTAKPSPHLTNYQQKRSLYRLIRYRPRTNVNPDVVPAKARIQLALYQG